MCRELRRTGNVGLCGQWRGRCVGTSHRGFANVTYGTMILLEFSWLGNDVAARDAGEVL